MMVPDLPISPAAERNKQPILEFLRVCLPQSARVLEIGSGTGQHAIHFARHLSGVTWQATEMPEHLPLLAARIEEEGQGMPAPLPLDVIGSRWPEPPWDAVFTANTLHIMPWDHTPVFLRRASSCLVDGGLVILYGPFHYGGEHTSDSNQAFSDMLTARDPSMGVRDANEVESIANACGLDKRGDLDMPANNRILVFEKSEADGGGLDGFRPSDL